MVIRWYRVGVKVTIDKAGRLVIPKELRDRVGLRQGEVDIVVDGAGLRIEMEASAHLEERDGYLLVPASGADKMTDEDVREMRLDDQR